MTNCAIFRARIADHTTGFGYSAAQVASVQPSDAQVLLDYFGVVHQRTLEYLRGLQTDDLDRELDEAWDPLRHLRINRTLLGERPRNFFVVGLEFRGRCHTVNYRSGNSRVNRGFQ